MNIVQEVWVTFFALEIRWMTYSRSVNFDEEIVGMDIQSIKEHLQWGIKAGKVAERWRKENDKKNRLHTMGKKEKKTLRKKAIRNKNEKKERRKKERKRDHKQRRRNKKEENETFIAEERNSWSRAGRAAVSLMMDETVW